MCPIMVTKQKVTFSVVLSLFWVVFLWGLFEKGPQALGLNAAIYLGGVIAFFVAILYRERRCRRHDLAWIIPLFLLAFSYVLFENPFFKGFDLLAFPVLLAMFYNYAWVTDKEHQLWGFAFATKILERIPSAITHIGQSIQGLFSFLAFKENGNRATLKKIIIGVILLIVCLFMILPLLSSADVAFADKLGGFDELIKDIVSTSIIAKLFVFLLLAIGTMAAVLAWGRPHDITGIQEENRIDDVISGIVLGGILLFYMIFLWVQIDRLWVGALPFDFKATESLVKSGFWQLLVLSFLNLVIFFVLYRKTTPVVQKLLGAFTVVSLLLLVSSAHRMWLYVTYYGFSYEKFYASYVVLFCGVLFVWLLSQLFRTQKVNVIKFVAFLFLWMFAAVSIFPVEQFVD